jgi:hypothetical protein
MFPLGITPIRQAFAHGIFLMAKGFVRNTAMLHHQCVSCAAATCDLICKYCYPSPFLRPDHNAVRPFFWQTVADEATSRGFAFSRPVIVVNCAPITTQRGSHPCVNPLLLFPSPPSLWRVASKVMANARWWARALVPLRPKPLVAARMTRFWQALPGQQRVHCATTRAFAADLSGHRPTIQDHPGAGLGGLLHFWGTAHV